jgi:hypothetical protein
MRWIRSSRFVVVSLRTYAVKQLASSAKIEAKIQVVCSLEMRISKARLRLMKGTGLEIVMKSNDIAIPARHPLENGDLIAHLIRNDENLH